MGPLSPPSKEDEMRAMWIGITLGVALAAALAPVPAGAFGLSGFGGKVGLVAPSDGDNTAAVSVHAEFEDPTTKVHFMPSIGFWDSNRFSDVFLNADLYYHFFERYRVSPYLGAGLGLNFLSPAGAGSNETDPALNLLGGIVFPAMRQRFFVEARYTAMDPSQFQLLGGATFFLHR